MKTTSSNDSHLIAKSQNKRNTFFDQVLSEVTLSSDHFIIKAPAGSGKTHAYTKLLIDLPGHHEIFVPSLRLAKEVQDRINILAGKRQALAIEGRSSENCKRFELAETIGKMGVTVYQHLCRQETEDPEVPITCNHYHSCPYLQQFQSEEPIRIKPHAYLTTDRLRLEADWSKEIRTSVIDERVWPDFVRSKNIMLDDLVSDQDSVEIKSLKSEVAQAIIERKDVLSCVTASLEEVTLMKQSLKREAPATLFHPQTHIDVMRKALGEVRRADPTYRLLKSIETDLANSRTVSDSIEIVRGGLRMHYLKRLGKGQAKGRLILFDADASKRLNEKIFGKMFEFREIEVERNIEVVQVSDKTFSKLSLFPLEKSTGAERQRKLSRFGYEVFEYLRTVATTETLIVGYMELAGLLRATRTPGDDLGGIEHFGALRGIDEHKGRETVIVVGRNQPCDRDLYNIARAFCGADQQAIIFRPALSPGQMPTGPEPDERVQEILEQIREAETMQAIARLRDIQSNYPKKVILLSSMPLPGIESSPTTWAELLEDAGIVTEKETKKALALKLRESKKTMREIVETTGVSERTVRRWIK